jgi:hypothetical protein
LWNSSAKTRTTDSFLRCGHACIPSEACLTQVSMPASRRTMVSRDLKAPPKTDFRVVIVGRPNVGKVGVLLRTHFACHTRCLVFLDRICVCSQSSLFNRFAGRNVSLVYDQPGVTRDRIVSALPNSLCLSHSPHTYVLTLESWYLSRR